MSDKSPPAPEAGLIPDAGWAAGLAIPGYRLAEQIGQGGMAVVFRAVDERLGRPVALKVMSPALAADDAFRQRFIRESRRPPAHPAVASRPASPAAQGTSPADRAQVTICAAPAATCTSANLSSMQSEPARILTSGDGSSVLRDLVWSHWGSPAAKGTGMLEVGNCTPDCAQGTYTGYPASVSIWGLTPYGNGKHAYADMVVTAPGAPTPVQSFTSGLVP